MMTIEDMARDRARKQYAKDWANYSRLSIKDMRKHSAPTKPRSK